ncbi:MAG: hypothetical protein ABIH25_01215 [Candidatus Woesearchaeota archaeon]
MKEASWKDCLDSNSSIKVTPDKSKSKSLIETAKERIEYSNREINKQNANYVFEGYYSSILEILHALVLIDGYKVNNHVCLGYYFKEIVKRDDLFMIFDDCRFKRNSLVYYGKRMDFDIAKDAIEKAKKLFKELNKIISEKKLK